MKMKVGQTIEVSPFGRCQITQKLGPYTSKTGRSKGSKYFLYEIILPNGEKTTVGPNDMHGQMPLTDKEICQLKDFNQQLRGGS